MRSKVIAIVVIIAVLAGGGWWWFNGRTRPADAKSQTQYIQTNVKRGDIRVTISGTGPVASVNGVMVKSNQTGIIKQLMAQDGDKVKAGQIVVMLDNDNLEASLKQAEVDLLNTQASLNNLLNPQATAVRAQQLKVENARLTLKQRQQDMANLVVKSPRSGLVSSIKVTEGSDVADNTLLISLYDDVAPTFTVSLSQQVAALVKVGDRVTVNLTGLQSVEGTIQPAGAAATPTSGNRDANVPIAIALPSLESVRPGMVGQAVFTLPDLSYVVQANGSVDNRLVDARSQVAGTISTIAFKEGHRVKAGDVLVQLTNDTLALQLEQAANDLKTQEQALSNLLDPTKDPNSQVTSLRAKIDQAQITLSTRTSDAEDLKVKAPVAGQISSLTLRVGDRVTANQNLFRVADYSAMQITISVDELDVAKAKVGQRATVTLDALPGRQFTGKVAKINPEGVFRNDIATFEVTIQVENPKDLMAGMNSTVNVVVEERTNVLWLPAQAVQVRQGKAIVQVLEGKDTVVQKEIQVGLRTSQQVEITGGLNEGDQVIQTIIRPTSATQGLGGMFGGNRQQQQPATTFPQQQQQQGGGQQRQQQFTPPIQR